MQNLPHIFITHEFYPRRGGIATFVEEMAVATVVAMAAKMVAETGMEMMAKAAEMAAVQCGPMCPQLVSVQRARSEPTEAA